MSEEKAYSPKWSIFYKSEKRIHEKISFKLKLFAKLKFMQKGENAKKNGRNAKNGVSALFQTFVIVFIMFSSVNNFLSYFSN